MDAPFGSWGMQTFIAGLTAGAVAAPWVIKGSMDGRALAAYIEKVLVPELAPGTVVVLDNLATKKTPLRPGRCGTPDAGFSSCRPTVQTSIPLKWPSQSSRLISSGSARVPSPTCSRPSQKPATSTLHKSAGSTLRLQDMSQVNGGMLWALFRPSHAAMPCPTPRGNRLAPTASINPDRPG